MSEGNFSDTDLAAIEAVQRAVREKIEPWAKQTDALAEFPLRQIAALAELGVLGMNLPPQWGGPGISTLAFAACVEAIAGACGSTASRIERCRFTAGMATRRIFPSSATFGTYAS
jgi:alkylation response protein AidB-like acyl-CoA dehydrogenase